MNRCVFLVFALFGPICLLGQSDFTLHGVIKDSLGVELPYAILSLRPSDRTMYSESDGRFAFTGVSINDTLEVQALGYKSTKVGVKDASPLLIEMDAVSYFLEEISVVEKRTDSFYELSLGDFAKKCRAQVRNSPGAIIVRHIKNPQGAPGYLISVRFWADLLKNCPGLVRIRVYEVDSDDGPGKELTRTNQLISLKPSKKIHRIDISEQAILLPKRGAYVGIEFVKQNDECKSDKVSGSRHIGIGLNHKTSASQTYSSRLAIRWGTVSMGIPDKPDRVANLNLDVQVRYPN